MFFSSPLFLIGLVAVAIPIAVHLFNFRRYKKVYFSNVERLEQMQSETRKQSRLRQWVVLAARILAVVFLVLAFARPTLRGDGETLSAGSNDVSIYIDNSFSMENADGNVSLLEKAKNGAREIVAAYGQGDRFQLLTSDMRGRQFHWLSREEVVDEIDAVEVGSSTVDLSAAVRRQFDFLAGGKGDNKWAYVISDFQAATVDASRFPTDTGVAVVLVPLEASSGNNVYVDTLTLGTPVVHKGMAVTAVAVVRNDGDENLEKVPVALYINDKQRALASVDLPAGTARQVEMHFTVDEAGVLDGRVEVSDYPVVFDDKYYFSINVRERVDALLVEGASRNEFLGRLFASDSLVALREVAVGQLDMSDAMDKDVIIIDELASVTDGMAQSLRNFVVDGGTLVAVVGAEVDEPSYNRLLQLLSAPLLAGRNRAKLSVTAVDYDNLLYANVFDRKTSDVELPTVTDYGRLVTSSATVSVPLATLANGDTYISVTECGAGRLYLVAAPLRDAHTDFVRQALFVPTFYNMALYSVRPTPLSVSFGEERPVPLCRDYDLTAGAVGMRPSAGDEELIPDIRRSGNRSFLVPHDTPHEAGNYVVTQDGVLSEGLSFNYSRKESRMDFLGRDAVERLVKDNNLATYEVVRNVDKPLDSYIKERMSGKKLWHWCLVGALLMLLVETVAIRWKVGKQ